MVKTIFDDAYRIERQKKNRKKRRESLTKVFVVASEKKQSFLSRIKKNKLIREKKERERLRAERKRFGLLENKKNLANKRRKRNKELEQNLKGSFGFSNNSIFKTSR